MSNDAATKLRQGSQTAQEVYISVGVGLSWWEASEDMVEMLFAGLCEMKEPVAIETFRVAPRPSRTAMIKSALKHHASRVTPDEVSNVIDALKQLEKLSSMRNEIAHGHVAEINGSVDGQTVMKGIFLSSTITPEGMLSSREKNKQYAHTAEEIDEWREKVRCERGKIMDVYFAMRIRDQDAFDAQIKAEPPH